MQDLIGYYDYTPQDAVVHYISEDKDPAIHQYTRDGIYLGTITDPVIVNRTIQNYRPETAGAIRFFLVVVAECFPEKSTKLNLPNIPEWHPLLPPKDEKTRPVTIPVISGPHMGMTYRSFEHLAWVMFEHDGGDEVNCCHIYSLEVDPTIPCGYVHMFSGTKDEANKYCTENNIRCIGGN